MCRFFAGVITSHPALTKYRYIWRLDADARYFCPIQRDPFKVMFQHKKRYGYAIVLREEQYRAGHTLYQATQQFITDTQPKALRQLYRRRLRPLTNLWGDYNRCHFWNNLEILDLEFFRSRKWREYFEYLETEEGVWTERWGDALIRTLGVTMFLAPKEIEQFSDIGYVHHLVCVNPCGAAESCGLQHGDVYRQGHCSPWIAAWRPDDLAQLLLTDYAAWIYIVGLLTVLCFWMRKVKFWAWTMFCISCTLCLMF
jgi:hypothetical protein